MTEWAPWRSREVIWVKPRENAKGEREYRTKDGQVLPEETLRHKYEPIGQEPETQP